MCIMIARWIWRRPLHRPPIPTLCPPSDGPLLIRQSAMPLPGYRRISLFADGLGGPRSLPGGLVCRLDRLHQRRLFPGPPDRPPNRCNDHFIADWGYSGLLCGYRLPQCLLGLLSSVDARRPVLPLPFRDAGRRHPTPLEVSDGRLSIPQRRSLRSRAAFSASMTPRSLSGFAQQ